VLEQKGGSAAGTFHDPVCDLGYLQSSGDRVADAHQLTDAVDGFDEVTEIV
jgi:hypothetical protein